MGAVFLQRLSCIEKKGKTMNTEIDISNITLQTARLTLRPWREADLDDFYEYASVDGVGQMAGWKPHKDKNESREILKRFIEHKKILALEYQGKVIGSLGIKEYDEEGYPEFREKKCREIGYVLSKDYWGRGLMPEAVREVLRYLFQDVGLDVVFCGHFLRNVQSARVQEKCGFRHYAYGQFETKMGTVEEDEVNILTKEEWEAASRGDSLCNSLSDSLCRDGCRLLLFDLDGTLLRNDKTISPAVLKAVRDCREKGILIGVATSRGEQNALSFIEELEPDLLIASGGAVVKHRGRYLYRAEFSGEETRRMIALAREVCGSDCEITIDTIDSHYWNYRVDPKKLYHSWGDSIYTDFMDFQEPSLKMCVEIFEEEKARQLSAMLSDCDSVRFSDGYWYKFTKKEATKERAILEMCSACGIRTEEITAFGDDYADMGMLSLCGRGIAMGNAVEAVKEQADLVIGSNEEDGIAKYLKRNFDI